MKKSKKVTAIFFLVISLFCVFISGKSYSAMHAAEPIVPGSGVSEVKMLSDYFPGLKGTNGDTEIYVFEGEKPGGKALILGGTHPNEPSGYMSANVYIHASSGQRLSGSETRNLNRGFPGRPDGTLTEKVCYGITQLIKKEGIDLTVDLHEASPEYPVINAVVAHERAMPIASKTVINLQLRGIEIGLEPSPTNLRGLTHRELGDHTDTIAVLMETANPSQGRLRGKTDENLVLTGKDKFYVKAAKLGRLFVPFDENGHPLEERVGRHLTAINELTKAYSEEYVSKPIVIENIPEYDEITTLGIGHFLNPVE